MSKQFAEAVHLLLENVTIVVDAPQSEAREVAAIRVLVGAMAVAAQALPAKSLAAALDELARHVRELEQGHLPRPALHVVRGTDG